MRIGILKIDENIKVIWNSFKISDKAIGNQVWCNEACKEKDSKMQTIKCKLKQTVAMSEVVNSYLHLRGLPGTEFKQGVPQILKDLSDIHLYAPRLLNSGSVNRMNQSLLYPNLVGRSTGLCVQAKPSLE